MTATLTASLEDYLEAIFQIIAAKEAVKPKDIAKRLGVSNASVTGALRALAEKSLIHYAPYDVITLTPSGKEAARDVIRRHEVLRDFFVKVLSVEAAEADEGACRMEHSIPKPILERFVSFLDYVEGCPQGGALWIDGVGYLCRQGDPPAGCARRLGTASDGATAGIAADGKETGSRMTLNGLTPGRKGRVVGVDAKRASRRLAELGLTSGALVEVERVAPLGDPIGIRIRGYHLSLRKEEAEGVVVEVI